MPVSSPFRLSGSKERAVLDKDTVYSNTILQTTNGASFGYARHGRELMGFKSPVSVPVLGDKSNMNY